MTEGPSLSMTTVKEEASQEFELQWLEIFAKHPVPKLHCLAVLHSDIGEKCHAIKQDLDSHQQNFLHLQDEMLQEQFIIGYLSRLLAGSESTGYNKMPLSDKLKTEPDSLAVFSNASESVDRPTVQLDNLPGTSSAEHETTRPKRRRKQHKPKSASMTAEETDAESHTTQAELPTPVVNPFKLLKPRKPSTAGNMVSVRPRFV